MLCEGLAGVGNPRYFALIPGRPIAMAYTPGAQPSDGDSPLFVSHCLRVSPVQCLCAHVTVQKSVSCCQGSEGDSHLIVPVQRSVCVFAYVFT
jgi:hypothetical protein